MQAGSDREPGQEIHHIELEAALGEALGQHRKHRGDAPVHHRSAKAAHQPDALPHAGSVGQQVQVFSEREAGANRKAEDSGIDQKTDAAGAEQTEAAEKVRRQQRQQQTARAQAQPGHTHSRDDEQHHPSQGRQLVAVHTPQRQQKHHNGQQT